MDIEIVIDECGRVTFSAFPEGMLYVALGLDPHNRPLIERAGLLQGRQNAAHDGPESKARDDES